MGDILQLTDPAELNRRRDLRQSLRMRIDRRARELAARDQERYFKAILFEIYRGALDPELIRWWEPLKGEVGARRA